MSRALTRSMLLLFAAIILFALLRCGFLRKSCAFALLMAVLLFAAYIVIARRCGKREYFCRRIGAAKTCAVLTLVFLAVNVPVIFLISVRPSMDFAMFWEVANVLASGEELSFVRKAYVALFPHILGYSTFLSLFLRIFGFSTLVPALINLILTALSGIIIFKLVLRWLNLEAASFAYLLWVVCPSKMLYNTVVLSEPLYTFLILLFILLLSGLESKADNIDRPILWGAAAGAASAVILRAINASRPIAAIPIIAFFIWVLLLRDNGLRDRRKWTLYISFAVTMLALYFPLGSLWNSYVAETVGEEPAGVPGYSLYVGFNPESKGLYSTEDSLLLDSFCVSERSAVGAQARMLDALRERLSSGDIDFLKLFSSKLTNFLSYDEGGAYYISDDISPLGYSVLAVGSNTYYYALLLLTLLGTAQAYKRADSSCIVLVPLYVLGLTMAHMLVEVSGRYHYSIIPMLIIMAAYSCESVFLKKGSDNIK